MDDLAVSWKLYLFPWLKPSRLGKQQLGAKNRQTFIQTFLIYKSLNTLNFNRYLYRVYDSVCVCVCCLLYTSKELRKTHIKQPGDYPGG